ncbi:MAG: glycosyltransferase family 4 protein [Candidatus Krumholzibacteriia bacterium]|nr:glycosyltransferase family 4 protein [bacterium]MCB9515073.1 glycosyltransferase family 4 protein [Candidatus Latescibacterota bacterium]
MLRVAMVAYTYYASDPRVRREAEALAARGDHVDFFCLRSRGEPAEERLHGVRVLHLPLRRYRGGNPLLYVGSYCLFLVMAGWALAWRHLRGAYALVHANNMPDFMAFAGLLPRLAGRPLVLDIHDTMPEIYRGKFGVGPDHPLIRLLRLQERLSARLASRVLTSEHTKRDALVEHGLPAEKIEVLLNLPDPRIFPPAPPREPRPADAGFRLVFHGTLAERLGVDLALEAVARIGERIPGLRLDVIGDGDQRPALLALRDRLGLQDRVRFSDGMVPVEDLPRLLADADLAVIPTREGIATRYMLPTKLVEYATLGIPAIVAPTHTIRYYFDETQVAFFTPGDPESLAETIVALHEDPVRRRALALGAARFSERYSWNRHKQVYLDLVDALCAPARSS